MSGYCIVRLCLVFLIPEFNFGHSPNQFLIYMHHFNFIQPNSSAPGSNQHNCHSRLYALWHTTHSDKSYLRDVIPLNHVCSPVQLVPHFGSKANAQLTLQTALECSTEFWLNNYETKELYWSLHTHFIFNVHLWYQMIYWVFGPGHQSLFPPCFLT